MWSPPPFIILPFGSGWENVVEAQRLFETRLAVAPGMFPWSFVPMCPCHNNKLPSHKKQVPAEILSNAEDKKCFLRRSVFDLVKNTEFLELTDSKLLGWYLALTAEDRKLIQDEGGFTLFLQRHPALDVTRKFVYVKRQSLEKSTQLSSEMSTDLNKSRRPTYYGVSLCKNCGASIPFNTKTCRLCCIPVKTPEKEFYPSDQEKELGLLPTGVKEELSFGPSGVQDAPEERRTAQSPTDQSLLLASEESFRSACGPAEAPTGQRGEQCSQALILSQLWDEEVEKKSAGVTMYKDFSAQASFALDADLERHSKTPQGLVGGPEQGGYRGEETADLAGLMTETLPEYCSFDSTEPGTSYRDCSDTSQSGGSYHSGSDPTTGPRVVEGTDSYGSAESTSCRGEYAEWTRGDRLDDFGVEEDSRYSLKNEEFHSMMEVPEVGGAAWVSSWTPTPQGLEMDPRMNPSPADQSDGSQGEVAGAYRSPHKHEGNWACPEREFERSSPGSSGRNSSLAALYDSRSMAESPQVTVSQSVDVSGDFRASYTSTRATEARWSVVSRASNTEPPCATKNAAVNTGCAPPGQDQGTQTTSAPTAEKYTITEVCMADLDYFMEEFIKLQHARDELKLLQVKLACSAQEAADGSCTRDRTCECSQRAVRAELRLLVLQHAMCQQHCWRHYYTSPEGECSILSMEAPSENIKNVLRDLEEDYCEMKRKILLGVPLDELRPLSVNSKRIGSEVLYVPSQIIKDCLSEEEDIGPEWGGSQRPVPADGGEEQRGGGGGSVASRSTESVQTEQEQSDAPPAGVPQRASAKSRGADTPVPRQTGPPLGSTAGHKPGGARDPELSDAWYDAEEEFGPMSKGQKGTRCEGPEEDRDGTIGKAGKDLNCFLCVTGLPHDTTEDEVRCTFRKYQVSEINVTTFSSSSRVAMMTIGCPKLAEAAVKEMNGRTIRGHVVKVTSVCRPTNPSSERPCGGGAKPIFRSFLRARRTVTTQTPKNPKSVLSITAKPLQHRLEKLTNVQDTPTASGTCVPPHYATMGSFDTLMGRLTERHPEVERERIVRALVELRERNQGLLSGLPLKTIVDMTSDLLTRPSSSTGM